MIKINTNAKLLQLIVHKKLKCKIKIKIKMWSAGVPHEKLMDYQFFIFNLIGCISLNKNVLTRCSGNFIKATNVNLMMVPEKNSGDNPTAVMIFKSGTDQETDFPYSHTTSLSLKRSFLFYLH